MLQYILECMAFQLVFLIIYDVFLKRETFFQWNRLYLIGTYIISMVLPWVKIEAMKTTVPESFQAYPEFLWNTNNAAAIVTTSAETTFSISWEYALLFGGMPLATLFFAYKLYQIYTLRQKGQVRYFKDFTQIIILNSSMAFSFFKSIFMGDKVVEKEHANILQHELVHIRQRHSYDLMFFELMRIVGWFNPLVYVYQSRVSELHEFIADAHVAKTHKKEQYQLLLSEVFQTQNISFINQFFKSSLIKKRIVMLQKTRSRKIYQLKYLLLLPLVFGMLAYTSSESMREKINGSEQNDADEKLIADTKREIDNEISEFGTLGSAFFNFTRTNMEKGEAYIYTKNEYFKEQILYKMFFEEMKLVKFDDDVQPNKPMPELELPSTNRYESYVSRKEAFLILDKNLQYSIEAYDQHVARIDKKEVYPSTSYLFEVQDVKDLTGKELRAFNTKLAEIFEQGGTVYSDIILTDASYAFNVYRGFAKKSLSLTEYVVAEVSENKLPSGKSITKISSTIAVEDIEQLTTEEENQIFQFLLINNRGKLDWELVVKDPITSMKFVRANNGSYLSGPNGEKIAAKLIYDSTLSEKSKLSITEFLKKNGTTNLESQNTIRMYNQLVAERKRLLMSTNENNPIIVNLDAQLSKLKESLSSSLKQKVDSLEEKTGGLTTIGLSKEQAILQYNKLVNERSRLISSSNEKNPIIVNLDKQIAQLRSKAFGADEPVPFAIVDEVPVFSGCENEEDQRACFQKSMMRHISKNFRYPEEAQKQGLQGRVAVMLTVNTAGNIDKVKVRGPHKLLEDEAVRIISKLPKLKSGVHEGKKVAVMYSIPITFKLDSDIAEYEILPENVSSDENIIKSIRQYNQLVAERKRLLHSSNKTNPIIVNLDQQLDHQMEAIKTKIQQRNPSQKEIEGQFLEILKEREKLKTNQSQLDSEDVPFSIVDEVPVFPGCEGDNNRRECFNKMIQKHIGKNFKYPLEAQEKGIQGRVSIMFTISKDGSIQNVRMRGPDKLLEKEAARIISLLPNMTPGKQKGKAVNVPFSIPISFKLEGETNENLSNFEVKGDTRKNPPLIVIDGDISSQQNLSGIDQNDIAEIRVFKDNTALKKYGKKGKNGVVEILTKGFFNSNPKLASVYKQLRQLKKERTRLLKNTTDDKPIIKQLDTQIDALEIEQDKLVKDQLKKN